jgi:hypothetical protein
MAVFIYGLYDPRNRALRYIGKANNPEKRLKSHLRDRRRRKTPVYKWMNELASLGLVPLMEVLVECCDKSWPHHEIEQITLAKQSGAALLNVAKGGKEPHCPKETRQANGKQAAIKRNKKLWRSKLLLGQALKHGHVSEELKEKMRALALRCPEKFGDWLTI